MPGVNLLTYLEFYFCGNRILNFVPLSMALSTVISPSRASTKDFVIDNPKPEMSVILVSGFYLLNC